MTAPLQRPMDQTKIRDICLEALRPFPCTFDMLVHRLVGDGFGLNKSLAMVSATLLDARDDEWRAHLAATPQPDAEPWSARHVTLTARQLRNALEFAAPDFETDDDQRETAVCISWAPDGMTKGDDDEALPAGLRVWYADMPEEGCIPLLDEFEAPPAIAAVDPLEVARDALAEIALAGMSGCGQESEEGMRDWHARRAWDFIGIAARAKTAIDEALAASKEPR